MMYPNVLTKHGLTNYTYLYIFTVYCEQQIITEICWAVLDCPGMELEYYMFLQYYTYYMTLHIYKNGHS